MGWRKCGLAPEPESRSDEDKVIRDKWKMWRSVSLILGEVKTMVQPVSIGSGWHPLLLPVSCFSLFLSIMENLV